MCRSGNALGVGSGKRPRRLPDGCASGCWTSRKPLLSRCCTSTSAWAIGVPSVLRARPNTSQGSATRSLLSPNARGGDSAPVEQAQDVRRQDELLRVSVQIWPTAVRNSIACSHSRDGVGPHGRTRASGGSASSAVPGGGCPGCAETVLDGFRGGVLAEVHDASGVIVHSLWKSAAIAWLAMSGGRRPPSCDGTAVRPRLERLHHPPWRWRWELKTLRLLFRGGGRCDVVQLVKLDYSDTPLLRSGHE